MQRVNEKNNVRVVFMQYKGSDHTLVICAYKESPFLEECIVSLKKQNIQSHIILVTSTPNSLIQSLTDEYEIPFYINTKEKGITQDWNFGMECARTSLVTIAHQDDTYEPQYVETMLREVNRAKQPLIFFSNYGELREGKKVDENKLLKVKRLMLKPLEVSAFWNSIFVRRRILSLGAPICCPSVTYAKNNLKLPVFQAGFRSCEDWEAWEKLSREKGSFVYSKEILMHHRIHAGSETSIILGDSARKAEDYQMFCKFWPEFLAKILVRIYSTSEKSNELEKK